VQPDEVAELQTGLRHRELYGGPIDGLYGPMTRAAIRAYERGAGRLVVGLPVRKLLKELATPPPLPARKPQKFHGRAYPTGLWEKAKAWGILGE